MSDDTFKKVAFDGRLQYHDMLRGLLEKANQAAIIGDPHLRYKVLRSIYSCTYPYIRKEDQEEIIVLLNNVSNKLYSSSLNTNNVISALKVNITRALDLIDDKLHLAADDLFLPKSGEESDDVDWDKIMRDT